MSYLINNQQKLNDLIFENRNKDYGAYAIRSAYGNTVFKSLSFMILGFSTIVSIAYYATRKSADSIDVVEQLTDITYTVPMDLEKKVEPIEPAAGKRAPMDPGKSSAALTSVVVSDSVVADTHTMISDGFQEATKNTSGDATGTVGSTAIGTGTAGEMSTSIADIKGNFEVDSMPEFEGGLGALYRFVSSKLKYPERALDDGIQGTVFVKFVVDEKGKVGNLSLLNNLGYGLDDEAQRVVALIPNFKKPAKVKGKAVKVYYQLPIKFRYK